MDNKGNQIQLNLTKENTTMKTTCPTPQVTSTACADIGEQEADYFARCILMPEDKFRELAEQGYTIDELSQTFIVPNSQVALRLEELGIDHDTIQDNRRNAENIADFSSTALVGGGLLAAIGLLFL